MYQSIFLLYGRTLNHLNKSTVFAQQKYVLIYGIFYYSGDD